MTRYLNDFRLVMHCLICCCPYQGRLSLSIFAITLALTLCRVSCYSRRGMRSAYHLSDVCVVNSTINIVYVCVYYNCVF